MTPVARRSGYTLLELLLVVVILALLLGLLLPAVQRVRETAARSRTANNLRQIQLAALNFTSAHGDKLPAFDGAEGSPNPRQSVFVALLPLLEQGAVYQLAVDDPDAAPTVGLLLDSSDPTVSLPAYPANFVTGPIPPEDEADLLRAKIGLTSYAANAQVFRSGHTVTRSVPDGLSQTIGFAMHYAGVCAPANGAYFKYAEYSRGSGNTGRRATFADGAPWPKPRSGGVKHYLDYFPSVAGSPPAARPAQGTIQGLFYPASEYTFQVAPNPADKGCDPYVPQTPYRAGLYVALLDGSVRLLHPTIAERVFWGVVSQAGGEILPDW